MLAHCTPFFWRGSISKGVRGWWLENKFTSLSSTSDLNFFYFSKAIIFLAILLLCSWYNCSTLFSIFFLRIMKKLFAHFLDFGLSLFLKFLGSSMILWSSTYMKDFTFCNLTLLSLLMFGREVSALLFFRILLNLVIFGLEVFLWFSLWSRGSLDLETLLFSSYPIDVRNPARQKLVVWWSDAYNCWLGCSFLLFS